MCSSDLADGLRVIGVASAVFPAQDLPEDQHDFDFRFLGLVGLEDPVRPDVPGAIAAYQRAMALDPTAAEITADLADLYLDEGRVQDAMSTAEQALKVSPSNRTAHRVLGILYSELLTASQNPRGRRVAAPPDALPKAIEHLEQSIETPPTFADFSARARAQGLEFALDVEPGLAGQWRGDPARVRQVVVNLVSKDRKSTRLNSSH